MTKWQLWIVIQNAYFGRWLHCLKHTASKDDHRAQTRWWQAEGEDRCWPPNLIACQCGRKFWDERWID